MAFEERNHQIDNLKGMLIFLVVLGHGLELVRQDIFAAKLLYVFIYQFHMPVFVFLSGCTSKNLEKGRRNAVENFLVPFLALNIAWNVLHFAITYLYGGLDSIEKMVDHPWHSLLTPAWTLWYILALFIWKMLLPDLCRVKHILFFSLCAGIFAGLFYEFNSFLALSRVIKLMPFFLFGYFYDTDKPRIFFPAEKAGGRGDAADHCCLYLRCHSLRCSRVVLLVGPFFCSQRYFKTGHWRSPQHRRLSHRFWLDLCRQRHDDIEADFSEPHRQTHPAGVLSAHVLHRCFIRCIDVYPTACAENGGDHRL